jgi:hypothetical protein
MARLFAWNRVSITERLIYDSDEENPWTLSIFFLFLGIFLQDLPLRGNSLIFERNLG